MSHLDQILFQSEEKLLSSDLNRTENVLSLSVQDICRGLFWDLIANTEQNGFLFGFDLTATTPAPDMVVHLQPGFGFQKEGTAGSYDSNYRFFRITSQVNVTIAAAHATLPRIDLIQIKHATQDLETVVRDFYNNATGLFETRNLPKRQSPYIDTVALYKQGTPAVSPSFPTTNAGYLESWYVFVPAAATTIPEANLIDARHWITPRNANRDAHLLNGLQIEYVDANNIQLTRGMTEILGQRLGIKDANEIVPIPLASNLESGASEQLSTWYFWYLVRPQKLQKTKFQGGQNSSEEKKFLMVASTVQPEADGHPSASLTVNMFSGAVTLTETVARERCVLLGSVYNDVGSNIVPFVQQGSFFAWKQGFISAYVILHVGFNETADLDLTKYIPPGSKFIDLLLHGINSHTGTIVVRLRKAGDSANTRLYIEVSLSPHRTLVRSKILAESNRHLELLSTAPSSHVIDVYGYIQVGL